MFCRICGKEINEGQKYCSNCGTKQSILDYTKVLYIALSCLLGVVILCFVMFYHKSPSENINTKISDETNVSVNNPEKTETVSAKPSSEILAKIDRYQAKYFEIITRNNMFVDLGLDENIHAKDSYELNTLFKNVENEIGNSEYVKKYYKTLEQYKTDYGETTYDMVQTESQNYVIIDKFLNEVYQAVRIKLPTEEYKKLQASEIKWIKDGDKYCDKIMTPENGALKYGSFSRVGIIDAQINMRQFRALLLMLYL